MVLSNYLHRHDVMTAVRALDVTGAMKFIMVNKDDILEHGLSHAVLVELVNKYMDVRPPVVDEEDN